MTSIRKFQNSTMEDKNSKKFKPYKMMKITSKNKNKDSVICCFIFYKNQDSISY